MGSAEGFGPGIFNFGQTVSLVTSVLVTPTDNMFGSLYNNGGNVAVGGDRYGLAEVRFLGASPVPEPSTALLSSIAGVVMLGRRRRA